MSERQHRPLWARMLGYFGAACGLGAIVLWSDGRSAAGNYAAGVCVLCLLLMYALGFRIADADDSPSRGAPNDR